MDTRRSSLSAVGTRLGLPVALVGLLLNCGCQLRYPENLHYGMRSDPLVVKAPASAPSHLDPPGDQREWLANLKKQEGANVFEPATVKSKSPKEWGQLERALLDTFGTPLQPRLKGVDQSVKDDLKLDDKTLADGSNLFREHCLHCHGLTGNGQGPTGAWINPHPRDFRQGVFKFYSSHAPSFLDPHASGERKPRREDLVRTVTQGVEGTAMPAFGAQSSPQFGVLAREDIEKLVSYVIHLSLRGQVEYDVLTQLAQGAELDSPVPEYVPARLQELAGFWHDANEDKALIRPEDVPSLTPGMDLTDAQVADMTKSVQHGFQLFVEPGDASCIKCHLDFGRRNNFQYDVWGTVVRPMDLTLGVYRGGRRPIDLYWRIHTGIPGSNMPAFRKHDDKGNETGLKPGDIWDLVNFLEVLPYPKMRERYGIHIDGPGNRGAGEGTAE